MSRKTRERYVFDTEFVAPRTALETALVEIWQEVLAADRVGINDSFFDFNGDSILAAQVGARIRQATGVSVSMRTLFDAPTVTELATRLEQELASGSSNQIHQGEFT
jgi:acyl carrier protein